MAVNSQNVLVGAPDQRVTGAILSGPLGTVLPSSAVDEVDPALTDSGYVSSDGVTLSRDYSTTDINDWSGALVRRLLESFSGTITWAHLEVNVSSLKNAFGDDNVVETAATAEHGAQVAVMIGANQLPSKSWVFKMKDGNARILIVVPNGSITDGDDITFASNAAITLPVTLSCYNDEAGYSIYIFTDDGVLLGAGSSPETAQAPLAAQILDKAKTDAAPAASSGTSSTSSSSSSSSTSTDTPSTTTAASSKQAA